MWNMNHTFQQSRSSRTSRGALKATIQEGAYHQEESTPDLRCVSKTHDSDHAQRGGRAWCPPQGKAHGAPHGGADA
jgi:hypothetical protein